VANNEKGKAWIVDCPLEVGIFGEDECLLGDAPAKNVKKGYPGVGPLGGVHCSRRTSSSCPSAFTIPYRLATPTTT
jgi:hypothetical protein